MHDEVFTSLNVFQQYSIIYQSTGNDAPLAAMRQKQTEAELLEMMMLGRERIVLDAVSPSAAALK